MSYNRTTWATGDVVTATKLNNIELGILANESSIENLPEATTTTAGLMSASDKTTVSGLGTAAADIETLKSDLEALEEQGYPMASITEAVEAWGTEHQYEIVNNWVTPEQFGAVGDGVTDDTTAVTTALTHAYVLLKGSYVVSEAVASYATHIFGSGSIISANGALVCKVDTCIEGITISNTAGIALKAEAGLHARNISITGGVCGIQCGATYTSVVDIDGATIKTIAGDANNPASGIYSETSDFVNIRNCYIEDVSTTGTADADGIKIYKQDNSGYVPAIISNCTVHNCQGRHIKDQTVKSIIENCSLYNDTNYSYISEFRSIDLQYSGKHIICNCRIYSPRYGIYIPQGSIAVETELLNNIIHSSEYYALVVAFTSATLKNKLIIRGCDIVSDTTNDARIYCAAVSTIILEDNNFGAYSYPIRFDSVVASQRLEFRRNTVNANSALFNPAYKIYNLYMDDSPRKPVLSSSEISFSTMANYSGTRFYGKISDITDITSDTLIERQGYNTIISNDSYYRVYSSNGTLLLGS